MLSVPEDETCPACRSARRVLDPRTREAHCADCGLVFSGSELVNYPSPVNPNGGTGGGRGIGPSVEVHGTRRDLGTTLSGSRDARGNPLPASTRLHYGHLGWMMRREVTRGSQRKSENPEVIEAIGRAASRMDLPPVVKVEAARVFHEGSVRGLFRGRSLPASVGAALYTACRSYRMPQTLVEVSEAVGVRRWEVGRAFKTLNRGLPAPVPLVGFKAYLQRYAEELALSPSVRSTVEEMIERAADRPEVSGLSPHGLVAALIYIASEQHGEKKRRSDLARVGSVTEMTLRSTTKLLDRLLKEHPARAAKASARQ